MKELLFNLLYQCAFKENVAGDVLKATQEGLSGDGVTDKVFDIYGPDLNLLTKEQIEMFAQSINKDGEKYLYRKRNRMGITDFLRAVGL